jgi:Tfp pilus assembly protein PilF
MVWLIGCVAALAQTPAPKEIPEQARKYFERGNEFVKKDSLGRAKGEYTRALQAYPQFKDALYNLAVVCEQLNLREEAIANYQKYLELSPTSADVWTQLGVLYDTGGDKVQAEQAYRKALESDAQFGRAQHNLGVMLEEAGKYDEAGQHLKEFVKLEEAAGRKNGDAYYSLGVFYLRRGQGRNAKLLLQKALDTDPSVVFYNNAMGDVYLMEKEPEVAMVYYKKALDRDAKYALAHSGLGDAYRKLGQTKEAAASYRKALELRPDYDLIYYKLGLLYEAQQPAEAIKDFEKYLKSGKNLEYQDEVNAKLAVLKQFQAKPKP